MNIVIIVKAAYKNTANAWLRNRIGATGDNITVPLILKSDPDTQAPRAYGTNWDNFSAEHYGIARDELETVQNQVEANRVRVFRNVTFDNAIAQLNLRIKPSAPIT